MAYFPRADFSLGGGSIMSISYDDVGNDLRRVVIMGRLDVPGTDSIATKLVELTAAPKKGVVVDLSALKFLASIGISALITSAKAVKQRGGKMVLVVSPGSSVAMSLEATGVDELIPIFSGSTEAERAAVA
jgi:anti-anti-sigma factor